jgi:hypothetical protein
MIEVSSAFDTVSNNIQFAFSPHFEILFLLSPPLPLIPLSFFFLFLSLCSASAEKSEAAIHQEIQAIIRQITASVTFLPLLNDTCTIDLLAYTDKESEVPFEWEESDPRYITSAANVKLRSFSTSVHNVEALVSYKAE